MVDLGDLVDDPLQLERIALHLRGVDGMLEFAVGTEQPAAIGADPVARAHQAEFHGKPEEARHGAHDAGEAARPLWLSRMPAVISAAVTAHSPKRTSVSANCRSVCMGTWPATSWKMSGSGR